MFGPLDAGAPTGGSGKGGPAGARGAPGEQAAGGRAGRDAVADAKARARALLEQARRDAQALAAAARQQGYEAGRREGLQAARAEAAQLMDSAQALLAQARRERQAILQAAEADIARLAFEIARKVVGDAIQAEPAAVLPIVRAAVERLAEEDELVVRVNPRDAVLVEEQRAAWLEGIPAKKAVRVVEDSSVEPGGCVIESEHGMVDARTGRRLDRIERVLEEVIRSART